jgi:ribosome-associated heat shock protein Hsp15
MRLDSWLWTTRFFMSRSQASAACRAGKVRVGGTVAKASSLIKVGDRISWRDQLRMREVEVVALPAKRVGAPEAALAYVDYSPPLPSKQERAFVPVRDKGAGRPEKKERRDLDKLRGFQK